MTALLDTGTQVEGGHDGVAILQPKDYEHMRKAPHNTKYTLNGLRYRIKQGDPIPEGAVLDEERAEKAAPEDRAEKAAPENRSAKKRAKKDD